MNANKQPILVPMTYVERGNQFGIDMVAWYDSPAGRASLARRSSGGRGTEHNPIIQAQGKIGEVAAAIYCGIDPETLKWHVEPTDVGWDIALKSGLLIDVKTTLPPFHLIWSRTVNDRYLTKTFDVLLSVSIAETNFQRCWIEGWVTKLGFYANKQISDGHNSRLEVGTWFMPKEELSNARDLPFISPAASRAPRLSVVS